MFFTEAFALEIKLQFDLGISDSLSPQQYIPEAEGWENFTQKWDTFRITNVK